MLLGISPLCLYHNIPMLPVEQTLHPRRFLEQTYYWFACPVGDCNQRNDMGHGYHTLIHGKLDDTPDKQPCPECSFPFMWPSSEQHWQIRCGSAQTKIVCLIGGRHEVLFGFGSGTLSETG